MNLELLIDEREHDAFYLLAPHFGVLDTQTPFKVSGNLELPGPVMFTIASFIHEYE